MARYTGTVRSAYEQRMRRMARRLGYSLHSGGRAAISPEQRGGYQLRTRRGRVVAGKAFELSLSEVEAFLRQVEDNLRVEDT